MNKTSKNSVKEFKYYDLTLLWMYVDGKGIGLVTLVSQTGKISGLTRVMVATPAKVFNFL